MNMKRFVVLYVLLAVGSLMHLLVIVFPVVLIVGRNSERIGWHYTYLNVSGIAVIFLVGVPAVLFVMGMIIAIAHEAWVNAE